jgi:tetratricopeptide (TPR) repeat protein
MRVIERILGKRPSTVDLLRRADRYRRQGRYDKALTLVTDGLSRDPNNLLAHLLAAYLHVACRRIQPAKTEFRWILSRDATQPRALLGLARISLEEGDRGACLTFLNRALHFYADFPEARALLDAITAPPPPAPGTTGAAEEASVSMRLDRLHAPPGSRELFLARADGSLLFAHCHGDELPDELPAHVAQVMRLASASLTRSGLGPVRRAIIEEGDATMFLRSEAGLQLALTFPSDIEPAAGLLHMNRLCAAALNGLAPEPAPAGPSR